MIIQTARDLGLALRDRRRRLRMSQADLARRIGTNRYWVIGMERGNDSADLGLMLRAVKALGLWLDLGSGRRGSAAPGVEAVDIDAIVDAARAKS